MQSKKILVWLTTLAILLGTLSLTVFAAGESATVYVTISNGTLVLTQEAVTVTDIDGDGALTINDALYLAHEAKYAGGAAAGYLSSSGPYGLAINKLWGIENGGSYGYYHNHTSAMSLTTPVKEGDHINAFVYTDTAAFSDTYCYFDVNRVSAVMGQAVTLTLSAAGFDANWAPIVKPVADAVILIDGVESSFKTDTNGKVTIQLDSAKSYVISAKSSSSILVPPACIVSVSEESPKTQDNTAAVAYIAMGCVALVAVLCLSLFRKNAYEK